MLLQMRCPWASYNENLKKLDEKWIHFVSSGKLNVAEFNKLFQDTLEISRLDVSINSRYAYKLFSYSVVIVVPTGSKS